MKQRIAATGAIALALWSLPLAAEPVTSITQYGVTWTFDQPVESGAYASGDHWVVGPVTVVSVSPAPTGTRNGSAVNPMGGRQGYDDRGGQFATDDVVTFPYVLEVDQSLVSSVSKPEGIDPQNVGPLVSQAVLTAVAAPLPPTALRPSYAGTYKAKLDTGSIQWSLLPNLSPPGSAPNGQSLLAMAERPRIDHLSSWTIQHSCAEENWNNGPGAHACYGREYSSFVSAAAQYAMLDTPERDELVISLIQLGIDNYGVIRAGGNWAPNGGHHNARKWPIVLAAQLLDDCDMLKVGEEYGAGDHFGEDGHTYYGQNGKALFGWDCGGGHGSYFENGCSGGGAKDCRDPAGMVDACPDYRNCCTSGYWIGQALAARMLHAEPIWGHDAYFDYVDRWMSGDVDGGGSASSAFIEEMWSTYRDNLPPGSPASTVCGGSSGAGGTAGASGSAGSSAGGGGGSSGSSGAAGSNGGTANAASSEDDGGCGCRTAPTPTRSTLALLVALLALGVRRRVFR